MVSQNYEQQSDAPGVAVCTLSEEQSQTIPQQDKLSEEQLCMLIQMISTQLLSVGVYPHLLGYQYLRSAVIHGLNDPEYLRNLSAVCYPQLAKEFHTNVRCVERAIRHALDRATSRDIVHALPKGRKSNREFLIMFTEHIRMQIS